MSGSRSIRHDIIESQNKFHSGQIDSFFKYFRDDPKVFDGIFKDHVIRFTQPRSLNDPLEFNPSIRFHDNQSNFQNYELDGFLFPSVELFWRVQMIEAQINSYGILALSKIPDSFNMWSQYSNGHKGFVIEFKPDFNSYSGMTSSSGKIYEVKKVIYVNDYEINLDHLADQTRFISVEVWNNELFFKKTSRWKHENEYRMVRPLSDDPKYQPPKINLAYSDFNVYLFPFDPNCIASIIIGASMSKENKTKILAFCDQYNIVLHQAHIIRDVKDWLDEPCTISILGVTDRKFVDSAPQLFCTDTVCLDNRGIVKIKQLSDLPYYQDHEHIVEELYANLRQKNT